VWILVAEEFIIKTVFKYTKYKQSKPIYIYLFPLMLCCMATGTYFQISSKKNHFIVKLFSASTFWKFKVVSIELSMALEDTSSFKINMFGTIRQV